MSSSGLVNLEAREGLEVEAGRPICRNLCADAVEGSG